MTTTSRSGGIEELLRPLAEARVKCVHDLRRFTQPPRSYPGIMLCAECGGDPREGDGEALDRRFRVLWDIRRRDVDASLGAIVRALDACDLYITFLSARGLARIESRVYRSGGPMEWSGDGDTPEEGLALAFVAAVGDGKAHNITEPMQP